MHAGHRAEPAALRLGKPALGSDQKRGRSRRQRQGGGVFAQGFVGEDQRAALEPVIQQAAEGLQRRDLGDECAAALLGRLDRMGLQTVLPDPLGIGEVGLHRQDACGAEFGRLLDNEIGARLLDGREDEPKVGRHPLRRGLALTECDGAALGELDQFGPPFAIATVEQRHRRARLLAQYSAQIMRLRLRQANGLPLPQRLIYKEPYLRACAIHVHGAQTMTEPKQRPEAPLPVETVADAIPANWVDRYAPPMVKPYLRLSRLDRPVGTWLLLLPCWWGLFLGAAAEPQTAGWLTLWLLVGSSIGAVLMRGAGCTWNDITDRDIDDKVARTRSRPIPSEQVSPRDALVWMGAQMAVAALILFTFNWNAIGLGLLSLALVAIYPFAKRFTWWPQVFLGLAMNWGALLMWTAQTGSIGLPAVFLYLAGICWTLFYDTIYAHQDREDDALIGVKSTARLFGDKTDTWLRWFLVAAVLLMSLGVIYALAPLADPLKMSLGLAGAWALGLHMNWQLSKLDVDDTEKCLGLFRSNREAGLLAALFLAITIFV